MNGRRTGITGLAGLILLASAVSGCGGGGSPGATPSPTAPRASAGGQRLSEVDLPDTAPQLAAVVQRQVKVSESVRVTTTTSAEGTGGKSSVEITGALIKPVGKQAAATLKVIEVGGKEAGTTHVMVGGGSIYARIEGEPYTAAKPWLRVSREDLSQPGLDGTLKETYENALGMAEQAVQQSTGDVGVGVLSNGKLQRNPTWEKFDGVDVRRYSGTTDTETLAAATGDQRLRQMEAGGFEDYPWTIWIDRFGLPRQFVSTIVIPKAGTITSRATYQAWGQPITITFPPPTQVSSITGS
jgi:hypothetical protein